ncbi:MAG: hypothetical protein ACE5JX_02335 [Acidobacteriota bacterium]
MANDDLSDLLVNPRSRPRAKEPEGSQPGGSSQLSGAILIVLALLSVAALALGGTLAYYLGQMSQQQQIQTQQLAAVDQSLQLIDKRLEEGDGQMASLKSQLEVTMHRVGVTQRDLRRARAVAEQLKEEQARNVAALSREISQKANAEQVASLKEESGRKFEGVDQEISSVKADVSSTRQELTKTVEQLTQLGVKVTKHGEMIATNDTGLQELRRRGERDYVEFDLRKKQRSRVAGIWVELRKTNPKGQRVNLKIYADDREMKRDHVDVNTPINFYVGPNRIRYELVINQVFKDRFTGYISVPKGKMPAQGPPSFSP